MHILICTPAFPPFIGGGERHTGTLARHLVDQGQAVTVLTSSALQEPDFWLGCGQSVEIETSGSSLTVIRVPIQPMPGGFRGLLAWRKSMVMLSMLPGTRSMLEKMAERVPGVTYKDSRTLSIDDVMGVGGHHIEIAFAHPDLAGWIQAYEANAERNGGR